MNAIKKWRERMVDKEPVHKETSATVDYERKALCIAKKLKMYDEFVGGLNGISWAVDNIKRAVREVGNNEQMKDKEVDDKEFGRVSILYLLKIAGKILEEKVMPYFPEMIEDAKPREEMSDTDVIEQIVEFNKAALKRYEKTKEEGGRNTGAIDFPYREIKKYFANCGYVVDDKWNSDYYCGISYPTLAIIGKKKKGE